MPVSNPPALFGSIPLGTGYLADTHSEMHGRVLGFAENVKAYGAVGDGVTNDQPAIQAAVDAGDAVFFPAGDYLLAEGSSITIGPDTRLFGETTVGAGALTRVNISCKNAYAVKTATGAPQDNIIIEGLKFVVRSGSTSGGGIKIYSAGSYNSNGLIRNCRVEGVATSVDPGIWVDGFIGGVIEHCFVNTVGGDGIRSSSGFIGNLVTIKHCTVSLAGLADHIAAAFHIMQGNQVTIRRCNAEGNQCYGIYGDAESGTLEGLSILDNWFENNWNSDVVLTGEAVMTRIEGNQFSYFSTGHGLDAGLYHVLINNSPNVLLRHCHRVVGNHFLANTPPTGVKVYIGTDNVHTVIDGNRGLGSDAAFITDAGLYTLIGANEGGTYTGFKIPVTTNREGGILLSQFGAAGVRIVCGTGSPETAVTASPGSLYFRTDGAAGTTAYLKETGIAATGWIALPSVAAANTWALGQTLAEGVNLVLGTGTGTKIGTATNQKLGFFNAAPVTQPAANPDTSGAILADLETEVNQLKATLRSLGLLAT